METFIEVIDLWPSVMDLAVDAGVEYPRAQSWRQRDNIPPKHWNAVIAAARRRKIRGVSLQLFANLAERAVAA